MTGMVYTKNIGGLVTVKVGSTSTSSTAAGTGDNTTKTGIAYDRVALNMPRSAVATVLCDATLTSGATLKVAHSIQHSSNNSDFTELQSQASTTVLTGTTGEKKGQISLAVDLGSANRYVRFDYVPDLSAAGTDTALTRAVWVFGGEDKLPAA